MGVEGHDPSDYGQIHSVIASDNVVVAGGTLTSIQNVYVSSPPSQVLDILYPHTGSPRIDARLFHNSKTYERLAAPAENSATALQQETFIFDGLRHRSGNPPILRHESFHPFRKNLSRSISLSVAGRLAEQGTLLASIILPSTSFESCTQYIVPTLAYQLAQNIPRTAQHVLAAIRHDPCIFERDTATQFQRLFETPLRMASKEASLDEMASWPSIIVVDGNAHQLDSGSVPHQVVQLLIAVSKRTDVERGPSVSLILNSSITMVDQATRAVTSLQQYVVTSGNTACYFTWRVHG